MSSSATVPFHPKMSNAQREALIIARFGARRPYPPIHPDARPSAPDARALSKVRSVLAAYKTFGRARHTLPSALAGIAEVLHLGTNPFRADDSSSITDAERQAWEKTSEGLYWVTGAAYAGPNAASGALTSTSLGATKRPVEALHAAQQAAGDSAIPDPDGVAVEAAQPFVSSASGAGDAAAKERPTIEVANGGAANALPLALPAAGRIAPTAPLPPAAPALQPSGFGQQVEASVARRGIPESFGLQVLSYAAQCRSLVYQGESVPTDFQGIDFLTSAEAQLAYRRLKLPEGQPDHGSPFADGLYSIFRGALGSPPSYSAQTSAISQAVAVLLQCRVLEGLDAAEDQTQFFDVRTSSPSAVLSRVNELFPIRIAIGSSVGTASTEGTYLGPQEEDLLLRRGQGVPAQQERAGAARRLIFDDLLRAGITRRDIDLLVQLLLMVRHQAENMDSIFITNTRLSGFFKAACLSYASTSSDVDELVGGLWRTLGATETLAKGNPAKLRMLLLQGYLLTRSGLQVPLRSSDGGIALIDSGSAGRDELVRRAGLGTLPADSAVTLAQLDATSQRAWLQLLTPDVLEYAGPDLMLQLQQLATVVARVASGVSAPTAAQAVFGGFLVLVSNGGAATFAAAAGSAAAGNLLGQAGDAIAAPPGLAQLVRSEGRQHPVYLAATAGVTAQVELTLGAFHARTVFQSILVAQQTLGMAVTNPHRLTFSESQVAVPDGTVVVDPAKRGPLQALSAQAVVYGDISPAGPMTTEEPFQRHFLNREEDEITRGFCVANQINGYKSPSGDGLCYAASRKALLAVRASTTLPASEFAVLLEGLAQTAAAIGEAGGIENMTVEQRDNAMKNQVNAFGVLPGGAASVSGPGAQPIQTLVDQMAAVAASRASQDSRYFDGTVESLDPELMIHGAKPQRSGDSSLYADDQSRRYLGDPRENLLVSLRRLHERTNNADEIAADAAALQAYRGTAAVLSELFSAEAFDADYSSRRRTALAHFRPNRIQFNLRASETTEAIRAPLLPFEAPQKRLRTMEAPGRGFNFLSGAFASVGEVSAVPAARFFTAPVQPPPAEPPRHMK